MSEPISPGKNSRPVLSVAAAARPRKAFTASLVQARGDASPNTRRDDDRSDSAAPQSFSAEPDVKAIEAVVVADLAAAPVRSEGRQAESRQAESSSTLLATLVPSGAVLAEVPPTPIASSVPVAIADSQADAVPRAADVLPPAEPAADHLAAAPQPAPRAVPAAVTTADPVPRRAEDSVKAGVSEAPHTQPTPLGKPAATVVLSTAEPSPKLTVAGQPDALPRTPLGTARPMEMPESQQPPDPVRAGTANAAPGETKPVADGHAPVDPSKEKVTRAGLFVWLSQKSRLEEGRSTPVATSKPVTVGKPVEAVRLPADAVVLPDEAASVPPIEAPGDAPPRDGRVADDVAVLRPVEPGISPVAALPATPVAAPTTTQVPVVPASGTALPLPGRAELPVLPVQGATTGMLDATAARPLSLIPAVQEKVVDVSTALESPLQKLADSPIALSRLDQVLPVVDDNNPLMPKSSFLADVARIRSTEIAIAAPDMPTLARQPEMRQAAALDIIDVAPVPEPVPHMFWGEAPRVFPQQVTVTPPSMPVLLPPSVQMAGAPLFGSAAMNIGRMTFQQTAMPMRIVYDATSTRRWWHWYRNYTQVYPRVTYTVRGDLLPGTATEFERR